MKDAEKWLQEALVVEGPRLAAMIDATSRDPVEVIGEWAGDLAVAAYEAAHRAAMKTERAGMPTLAEFIAQERERARAEKAGLLNVLCSECKAERLTVTHPGSYLASSPLQIRVHCTECGWSGNAPATVLEVKS